MKALIARLVREDEGQDLIEYGLLLGLITVAVITFVTSISGNLTTLWTNADDAVATAAGN